MTREEILNKLLSSTNNNILLELSTGVGKTKLALDKINSLPNKSILIVVSRLVHIDSWKKEFKKWKYDKLLKNVRFTTYQSLHKYATHYNIIVFDECQHITDRVVELMKSYTHNNILFLSATLNRTIRYRLSSITKNNYEIIKVGIKDAIDNDILPEPEITLLPLYINKIKGEFIYSKRYKTYKGKVITISFNDRFKYFKLKQSVDIICTASEYLEILDSEIEYNKRLYMNTDNHIIKKRWLYLAGVRLIWLSSLKNDYISHLLKSLEDKRVLTFCSSIEQTEVLGKYCINSTNKESIKYLSLFNDKKINHITACNMLNEGVNLTECEYAIFANINSSEIITKQRIGRALRHPNPKLYFVYFKNTREEEILLKNLEEYKEKE